MNKPDMSSYVICIHFNMTLCILYTVYVICIHFNMTLNYQADSGKINPRNQPCDLDSLVSSKVTICRHEARPTKKVISTGSDKGPLYS